MKTVLLRPDDRRLVYSFHEDERSLTDEETIPDYRGPGAAALQQIARRARAVAPSLEAVVLLLRFGGKVLAAPRVLAPLARAGGGEARHEFMRRLAPLIPQAPLAVSGAQQLLADCSAILPAVPIVVLCQTAFFAHLAPREQLPALSDELVDELSGERFGYHGLFHEAAVAAERSSSATALRIISLCLDRTPEVAAVRGCRPLMVTGGATPLEGFFGERTSGAIDPLLVLTLARKLHCGPERINALLMKESGIFGVSGVEAGIEELLQPGDEALRLPREMFRYRLLQSAGAAAAALGGVDRLVVSGGLARKAGPLAEWLVARLSETLIGQVEPIRIDYFTDTLTTIALRQAAGALAAVAPEARAG